MTTTRAKSGYKDNTIYEERVSQRGEHYYHPYYVGRLLGKGGFAYCHEVKTINDDRMYAVKIIPKENDLKKRGDAVTKIRQEITILKSLSHPGVVKYYHDFQDNQTIFIILELCSGGSLNDILKKRKVFTEPQVRFFVAQMVGIMQYIQKKNIIHRDIKLANYFLDENFRLKLGDFGLATENNDELKARRKVCGTPNYIAPEVIEKYPYGFQIDAWSTGVVIFTMLYGVPPFETKSCKETYEKIRKADFKFQGANNTAIECSDQAKMFIKQLLCLNISQRLKFDEFMSHPFMSNFRIPEQLEVSFPNSSPSAQFVRTYSKPIIIRPINTTTAKKSQLKPQKPKTKTVIPVRFTPKTKGNVYKDVFKDAPAKERPITYHAIEDDQPIIKVEDYLCKREEPMQEAEVVKAEKPDIEPANSPTLKDTQFPRKKEEQDENRLNELQQSTNTKGRKQFQPNNLIKPELEEQTQKKLIRQDIRLLPSPFPDLDEWTRPKLKLKLKQISQNYHLIAEKKETKIIYWQYCSNQYGFVYVLSNHQIGFYFDDAQCMQLNSMYDKIYYFYREEGKIVQREIKLAEVYELLVQEASIMSKVQILMHFYQNLKARFPKNQEITNNDQSATSISNSRFPLYVKSLKKGQKVLIFSLSNGNNQFFFEDDSSIFFSLSSCFVSYRKEESLLVHSIPLDFKCLDAGFQEKVRIVCDHYSKMLKVRPGQGSERWLLRQSLEPKLKQQVKKLEN